MLKWMKKSGRLANGYERDKANVAHLVPEGSQYAGKALCGTQPRIQWLECSEGYLRVCPKCRKKSQDLDESIEIV